MCAPADENFGVDPTELPFAALPAKWEMPFAVAGFNEIIVCLHLPIRSKISLIPTSHGKYVSTRHLEFRGAYIDGRGIAAHIRRNCHSNEPTMYRRGIGKTMGELCV
jgi:hypothetical protein